MSDIRFEQIGRAGVVTLARPETLNAVTGAMVSALSEQLDIWEANPSVERVIIKAVPGRAFSAGGDIRSLYEHGRAGTPDFDFFAREYVLNARIARFPKPYIALVDGIVMGGGVGVSFHGSHVVAGDNIGFAMPEVGIGFFPDVGGSYLLSRLPGLVGLYLGLTGTRIGQADCLWSGLATHAAPSEKLGDIRNALCHEADIDAALKLATGADQTGSLARQADLINEAFAAETVSGILENLAAMAEQAGEAGDWAQKTLETLQQKSPTSLAVAYQQIKRGRELSMEECMRMEYRIVHRVLVGHDFYEGIRAAIIDKDRKPAWEPKTLAALDQDSINGHFETLGDRELVL
ncbi:MAG: enoyl-CoA hydratase/isomerase family protein [Pseudomonadota bacterium]